ncbi:MAG: hypothetical protein V1851_00580 [Patescibacteria group bacterium]
MTELKLTINEAKKHLEKLNANINFDRFQIFFPADKNHMMILNSEHLIMIIWKDTHEKINHHVLATNTKEEKQESLQIKKISFEGSQIEITYCGLVGNFKVCWENIAHINIS